MTLLEEDSGRVVGMAMCAGPHRCAVRCLQCFRAREGPLVLRLILERGQAGEGGGQQLPVVEVVAMLLGWAGCRRARADWRCKSGEGACLPLWDT